MIASSLEAEIYLITTEDMTTTKQVRDEKAWQTPSPRGKPFVCRSNAQEIPIGSRFSTLLSEESPEEAGEEEDGKMRRGL